MSRAIPRALQMASDDLDKAAARRVGLRRCKSCTVNSAENIKSFEEATDRPGKDTAGQEAEPKRKSSERGSKSSSRSGHANSKKDGKGRGPKSEREAFLYKMDLDDDIRKKKGQYLRGEDGSLHLILGASRIPLSFSRENIALARLMLEACNVSSLSPGAQAAIQRLQVTAQSSASSLTFKSFSGLSKDRTRLYIPIDGGELLYITSTEITVVANGDNQDKLWIEHPYCRPFRFTLDADPCEGLAQFERLVVETQSCSIPEMRWLVAMHEAFFPYVRDLCRARFLLAHIGGPQEGKTSGAQRFSQLHGLGEVKGDYSVAALANQPESGCWSWITENRRTSPNHSSTTVCSCRPGLSGRDLRPKDNFAQTLRDRPQ
jgi:hypothetical protein